MRRAAWLALPFVLSAQADPAPVALPDSTARTFARQLAQRDSELRALQKPDGSKEAPIVLDEVRIYGQVDPEDYVRRKARFIAFRERLERERPLTPKEKTQLVLCAIGLCGIHGPDGLPPELSATDRSAARTLQSSSELGRQFRGTVQ